MGRGIDKIERLETKLCQGARAFPDFVCAVAGDGSDLPHHPQSLPTDRLNFHLQNGFGFVTQYLQISLGKTLP